MTKPELYAVQYEEDPAPLPCRYCGVSVEHDGELIVFVYPLDQPGQVTCDACLGRLPGAVRRYYDATLAAGVALLEQAHVIMELPLDASDEELELIAPAVPFEQALDTAASAPKVVTALARQETARQEAADFLMPGL